MTETVFLNVDDANGQIIFEFYNDMDFIKEKLNKTNDTIACHIAPKSTPSQSVSLPAIKMKVESKSGSIQTSTCVKSSDLLNGTDEEYLMSMIPSMRNIIDDMEKLEVRVKILDLLNECVYKSNNNVT